MSEKPWVYEAGEGQSVPKLEQHPIGQLLPRMPQSRFEALQESVKHQGLLEPIVLFEGKILDGWTRYNACLAQGVRPKWVDFEGDYLKAIGFVQATNVERRHLTSSQLALLAVDFAREIERAEKQAAAEGNGKPKRGRPRGKVLAQAAKAVGATPRQAERAKRVVDHAEPDVLAMVREGEATVADAAAVVDETPAQQRQAAKAVKAKRAKTLRGAIQSANGKQQPSGDQEPEIDDHGMILGEHAIRAKADGEAMKKLAKEIVQGAKFLRKLIGEEGRGQHVPPGIDVQVGKIAMQLRGAAFAAVCPYCLVKDLEACSTCHGQHWVPQSVAKSVSDSMWKDARRAQKRRMQEAHERTT